MKFFRKKYDKFLYLEDNFHDFFNSIARVNFKFFNHILRNFLQIFFIVFWNNHFFNTTVIARCFDTGLPVSNETNAETIVIPAEGPSLGVAPSGT